MDKNWIEEASKYIREHNAFKNISAIDFSDNHNEAIISATVTVNLPSKFIEKGITDIGVKSKEEVKFVFSKDFPLKAPKIVLRDDFPKCFPHINPSMQEVIPCIYFGDLSELLQQPEWMNGILNQLVDWLEKAASNQLLNYEQGWEPMRNDNSNAVLIIYDKNMLSRLEENWEIKIYYNEINKKILACRFFNKNLNKKASLIRYHVTTRIIDTYIPNTIRQLADLYEYTNLLGYNNLKKDLEKVDRENIKEDKLFVMFPVRRPIKLIGSESNIELISFVIHKSPPRKKKKRVLPDNKVEMIHHIITEVSPELLKRISGTKTKINETKNIALVGCGSLGSKIGIHLGRNGNRPFICIDPDIFMPHNNVRHALVNIVYENKAKLLSSNMLIINNNSVKCDNNSCVDIDYSNTRLIIDTTGSFAVRNFFMSKQDLPPIISGGLYGSGRQGILFLENKSKSVKLMTMWAYLYHQTLKDESLRKMLFDGQLDNVQVGQSCSSQTLIVDDARISIIAAAMSLKIQQILEDGLSEKGEILFSTYNDNYSLESKLIDIPESIFIESSEEQKWQIFLFKKVYEEMKDRMEAEEPNETGGVLLGTVFLYLQSIVITDILPKTPDSIAKDNCFILGTKGLEKQIQDIEKKTNGRVTYLGTWHSHPKGGNASSIDVNTYDKLLVTRNYEPTVCLIITPDKIININN